MAEEGLDLGGVGSALAEARAEGVAAAVGAQSRDAGGGAGGQHDLGDAGDGARVALSGPGRAEVAAAFVQPGSDQVPAAFG